MMTINVSKRRTGQEGVALMVVLMFVVLLSVIVMEYAYETEVDASLTMNRRAEFQAYVAAKSAVATGFSLLEKDLSADDTSTFNLGTSTTTTASQSGQPVTLVADTLLDAWAEEQNTSSCQAINDAVMQCKVDDECGKINLSALFLMQQATEPDSGKGQDTNQTTSVTSGPQSVPNEALIAVLRALFQNMGLEEDPTDAILDWLDQDDDPLPLGAESEYYSAMDPPYACKNSCVMNSIEELLLIKGITPEIYFDCFANAKTDQTSSGKDDEEAIGPVCLADLLTVHGDPSGRINVNTARPEVIAAMLAALGDTNQASVDAILAAREQMPFESREDLMARSGMSPQPTPGLRPGDPQSGSNPQMIANNLLDVRSSMFRIRGDGRCGDAMVRVEAFVYRDSSQAIAQGGLSQKNKNQLFNKKDFDFNVGVDQPAPEYFRIVDWRVLR